MENNIIINEEDIQNEENIIVDYDELKEIMNSGLENCICKINIEIKEENKLRTGTGFFCNIPTKKMKVLFTNNHILDEEYIKKQNKIIYYNYKNEKKVINLDLQRFKYTNEELDFTIIEIINKDKILDFLEIDDEANYNEYKNKKIFCYQYPKNEKLKYSHGIHLGNNDKFFLYTIGSYIGSSGSPILLLNNRKLIGLHKGSYKINNNKEKINIGIPIHLILDKINYIICTYNITQYDIGKDIQIINNGYHKLSYYESRSRFIYQSSFYKINKEIKKKMKFIINGQYITNCLKYKFDKEGIYNVYCIIDDTLKDISCLFAHCRCLVKINLSTFKTDNISNMSYMFSDCGLLKEIDISSFKTDNVTDMSHMFSCCESLKEINLSSFQTENVIDMSHMFSCCESLKEINLSSFKTDNVTDMSYVFCGCESLKEINLSSSFKTDNVTNMDSMFFHCDSLKEINLSSFKTDNVTNMCQMFCACYSLKEINLLSFKTDNVTNMYCMFSSCNSLKEIDLSTFKTDNVTNMCGMFSSCNSLKEINLSTFKTDNVKSMSSMFSGCTSLKELNLSSFKTDSVTNMGYMFSFCRLLEELNLSSFKTDNVVFMNQMFDGCESLKELNLSSFKTYNLTYFDYIFDNCNSNLNIICEDKKLKKAFNSRKIDNCIIY